MSHGQISCLPHSVPFEQSTFVSSHDSFYQRTGRSAAEQQKREVPLTGHLSNGLRPVRGLPFGHNISTAHATFGKGEAKVFDGGRGLTAHVRNHHIGSGQDNAPMVSTARASFGVPGPAPQGRDFRYAGDSSSKYNPNLLRMDEPPAVPKATLFLPAPPGKLAKRDGLHTNPNAKLDVVPKKSIALPARMRGHPSILHKTLESSAAGKMGGNISCAGLFDQVFQGTTTYRHFYVNQWKLPEKADCTNKKGKSEDMVRLNHVEVDYSAAKALNSTRGFDGQLVSQRPEGVHPTIWRLEQEKERSKI